MADELETLVVRLDVEAGDLDTLGLKLEEVEADLKRFGAKRYKATVDADTKTARANIEELRRELKRLEEDERKEALANKTLSGAQKGQSTRRLKALEAEHNAAKQQLQDEQNRVSALKRLEAQVGKVGKAEEVVAKERAKAAKDALAQDKAREKSAEAAAKAQVARDKALRDSVRAEQNARAAAAKQKVQQDAAQARADASAAKAEAARTKVEDAAQAASKKRSDEALARSKAEADAAVKAANEESQADLRRAESARKAAAMQSQLAAIYKKQNDLQSAYRRAPRSDKQRIKVDQDMAVRQMEELRLKLTAMGEKPIEIKTHVNRDRLASFFMGSSDMSTAQRLKGVFKDIGKAAKDGRVNILGMSMSVAGLVVGMAALAPVVTGIIGALGALVAVVGSGLAGAMGVAGAAMGGFAMAGLGIFAMLKPMVTQFATLQKSAKAVTLAIDKYGKGSKQAQQAQHLLNEQMKQASPAVRSAVKDWTALSTQWHHLTDKAANRDFGTIMASSLGTAKVAMKGFAKDSVGALDAVSKGWKSWMQDLASPAAQADFNNIFNNFNKSIPNIMSGLQHLGDAARRIFSAFSNFLPGLTHGFDNWAKGIDNATKNGSKLESTARTMVSSLRDVGHFAQAAGRFLTTFFKAGVGPGAGMLNDMTNGLNKVTKAMSTVSGQKRLTDFFTRSVNTTKDLWNALVPLIKAFTNLGSALRPVSVIALDVVSAFSEILAFLIAAKPLQYVLGAIFGGAIIGRAATSVASLAKDFGSLVKNMWTFVTGMGRLGVVGSFKNAFNIGGPSTGVSIGESASATMEASAAGIGTTIGESASAAMAVGGVATGAETAVAGVTAGETAGITAGAVGTAEIAAGATEATASVTLLGGAIAALTSPIGIVAVGLGGLIGAVLLLGNNEDAISQSAQAVNTQLQHQGKLLVGIHHVLTNVNNAGLQLAQTHTSLASSTHELNSLSEKLNMLQMQGKTHTAAYRDTLNQFNQKLQEHQQLQAEWTKGTKEQIKVTEKASQAVSGNYNKAMLNQANALKTVHQDQKAYNDDVKTFGKGSAQAMTALSHLSGAQRDYGRATNAATAAGIHLQRVEHDLQIEHFNLARAAKGLAPIMTESLGRFGPLVERAGTAIGSLVERMRMAGQLKGINFLMKLPDPRQITQITRMIDGLRSQGDVKKSFSILGDSKSASEAIKAINALSVNEKKVSIRANIAGALADLRHLNATAISDKHLTVRGDAHDAQSKINLVNKLTVTAKILSLLGNPAGALTAHGEVEALSNIAKTLTIGGDPSPAMAAISAVQSALAAIHSVTVALNVVKHGPATGISVLADGGHTNAPKGFSNDPVLRNKQRRAAVAAVRRPTERTRAGGMFAKPTYLVGEENRPEFVIATNPAYRKQNVGYLADAAHQFGMHLTAAAAGHHGGKKHGKDNTPKPNAHGIYTDPGAASNKKVGTPGEAGKHQDSKNPKRNKPSHPTPPGLPAADRIGGVGTADIDAAVAAAQQAYDTKKQNLTSARTSKGKPQYSAAAIASKTKGLKHNLDSLKAFNAQANAAIQRFTNLESKITATEAYMTAADASPTDSATGYNEQGRLITATWPVWLAQLKKLEADHTALLESAVRDAKNRIGKNPSAASLGYVQTLETALGTSIVDQQTADAETQPAAAGLTLEDYIAKQGLTDKLGKLNYEYAAAQIGNVADDPGTPQREDIVSLQDDIAASKGLFDFYSNLFVSAKKDQPTNYPLLTDAATDVAQAQQTYQGLLDQQSAAAAASGPTQGQLASTALYTMFQNFGSNTGNALLQTGPQLAATGFDPMMTDAAAGGAEAASALSPAARGATTGSTVHHVDNSKTAHVTNNYQTQPNDPHSWSKSLNWELENAL